jgi:hypothetical protein
MQEIAPGRSPTSREIVRWVAPVLVAAAIVYLITLLSVVFDEDADCLLFDPFGAPGVRGIERDLQWWPPAWDCRARGADGTLLRFRREWGASDAAWFAFWTFAVAGAWVLLRRLRLRRRARGPRGTGSC